MGHQQSRTSRRQFLRRGIPVLFVGAAGCFSSPDDQEGPQTTVGDRTATRTQDQRSTSTSQPEPTKAKNCSTPETFRQPASTPASELSAEDVLPEAKNGWQFEGREHFFLTARGGTESQSGGEYVSPDGTRFQVNVYEGSGTWRWARFGWDHVVSYGRFTFVVGTGTYQLTFTVHPGPHMDRTPAPDTEEKSLELLSYSPILTEEWISEQGVTCGR